MAKKYQAPAAEKLLSIVELMATQYRPYAVTEIASKLGITVNSAFRILKELEEHEYVQKDPSSMAYRLTGKLYYLGSLVGAHMSFRSTASGYMDEIADLTGETTLLAILDDHFNTIVIDQVVSKQMVKFISTVGGTYPTNTSVLGKAMLSVLPEDRLAKFFSIYTLQKATEKSITDSRVLREELASIRKIGYAVDDEESCIGIRCVGVPIVDERKILLGSLCISCPAYRLDKDNIAKAGQVLMHFADVIMRKIGAKG